MIKTEIEFSEDHNNRFIIKPVKQDNVHIKFKQVILEFDAGNPDEITGITDADLLIILIHRADCERSNADLYKLRCLADLLELKYEDEL